MRISYEASRSESFDADRNDKNHSMTDQQFKDNLLPLYRQMYGVAMAILADRQGADDCLQEAMASLWVKREEIDSDGPVKAYAMAAIRNQCITYFRGRKFSESLDQVDIPSLTASKVDEAESMAQSNSTAALIAGEIRKMSDNMRQVMELSVFGECDNSEIEQITGLSGANVRTLLSRGRKELRKILTNQI